MTYDNEYMSWDNEFVQEGELSREKDSFKHLDKGYNKVFIKVKYPINNNKKKNKVVRKKIEFYTTSGIGNRIRDATTGNYYNERVGTKGEELYFKVAMSNGWCTSENHSNTLFFISPEQYVRHFGGDQVDPDTILRWEQRRSKLLGYNDPHIS